MLGSLLPRRGGTGPAELDRLIRAVEDKKGGWCGAPPPEAQQLQELVHQVTCGRCDRCRTADQKLEQRGVDVPAWRDEMRQAAVERGLVVPPKNTSKLETETSGG
jgi:hypothetical protein